MKRAPANEMLSRTNPHLPSDHIARANMETGSRQLLRALWREHPAIMAFAKRAGRQVERL